MSDTPTLLSDHRPIQAVCFADRDETQFRVGWLGVEKIEAYGEPGSMAFVPWIAVYRNGQISHRFPAQMAVVMYEEIKP